MQFRLNTTWILLATLILLMTGLVIYVSFNQDEVQMSDPQPSPKGPVEPAEPTYQALAEVDSFREGAYAIYTVQPTREDIRMLNLDEHGSNHTFESIHELAERENQQLVFAMNGGMFNPNRTAQGLLVMEGKTINPLDRQTSGFGNFYMQPNGVLALDTAGHAYILPTAAYDSLAEAEVIAYATQSGPMMLVDSMINEAFNDGSPNKHIRNAAGVTADGRLLFVISLQPVTFFDLSTVLRKNGCRQALYLDGVVSRMYLPEIGIGNLKSGRSLGPLLALFR